ncbi:DNA polymerase III beta subunit [hydrothermal vent metagenome]|uniref:DNA polymerase III beta subunit n=1 Tax=hydrothermal vent metagenome TaxID=652676 RepID=A0A3B0Y0B4_9ZZZZ
MKLKILRDDLLQPLQQIIGAVEKRQTLPALANVLIKSYDNYFTITATDLEIELVSRVNQMMDEPGDVTLPAKKLLDICKALAADSELSIEVNGDKALIKSGRNRFSLSTLPASDFPALDEISSVYEFSVPQHLFKTLIDRTSFAMAQQDVRYYLNGLMLEVASGLIRTVATDGHRLSFCEKHISADLADNKQVIIPRKGIGELQRLLSDTDDEIKIILGNNHIQCSLPNQRFTSKLIDGRFPDYKRVMPEASGNNMVVNRDELKQALIRASILSNEKYRGIRIVMDNNLLKLQAQNPDQEEADVELEIQYEGEPIEMGINVNYMIDVLNTSTEETVQGFIKDANSSCLLSFPDDEDAKYVIMPMRL